MTVQTPTHHQNCEWQFEQYDWECTCGAAARHKLDILEKLSSPDAATLPDDVIAGRMIAIINSRGFLEALRKHLPEPSNDPQSR